LAGFDERMRGKVLCKPLFPNYHPPSSSPSASASRRNGGGRSHTQIIISKIFFYSSEIFWTSSARRRHSSLSCPAMSALLLCNILLSAALGHYENPYLGPCASDEQSISITGITGKSLNTQSRLSLSLISPYHHHLPLAVSQVSFAPRHAPLREPAPLTSQPAQPPSRRVISTRRKAPSTAH